MPDLTPGMRRALQYWGVVEHAATTRMGTAELWAAIREQATAAGHDSPGVTAQDISRLRGMAGGIRSATGQLSAAQDAFGLQPEMIGEAPWARPLAERNTLSMYQARFLHQVNVNGEPTELWRTVVFRGGLPATAGELRAAIEQDARQMADNYGHEHQGIGPIALLAI